MKVKVELLINISRVIAKLEKDTAKRWNICSVLTCECHHAKPDPDKDVNSWTHKKMSIRERSHETAGNEFGKKSVSVKN